MTLTARQKAERLTGVGASEVLAALGKDPRCTPLVLYQRKTGESTAPELENDPRVHFGTLLEPVLRQEFARRSHLRVIQRRNTLRHPTAPLVGHLDGWIPARKCGLEIKTADRYEADDFGEEDTDQVPLRYFFQCSAYMAITGAAEWFLVVLIGGNDYRQYHLTRQPELEDMMLTAVHRFWWHVEHASPPAPITPEDVRLRWPRDLGSAILATDMIIGTTAHLSQLRHDLQTLQREYDEDLVSVQKFMAENAELVGPEGRLLATWRTARASRRLDINALTKDHPELAAQYMREIPGSRRFLLK